MPHGMQLNTMAVQITHLQVEGLLPEGKKAFLEQLEEFRVADPHVYADDFGRGTTSEQVWCTSRFYLSDHGCIRIRQPNNIIMVWSHDEAAWMDNDHDD